MTVDMDREADLLACDARELLSACLFIQEHKTDGEGRECISNLPHRLAEIGKRASALAAESRRTQSFIESGWMVIVGGFAMKELFEKIVNDPAVKAAFWALVGAVAVIVSQRLGLQLPV